MAMAVLKSRAEEMGATRTGRFPPALLMTKSARPTAVERSFKGTNSTKMANMTPNHISAAQAEGEKRKSLSTLVEDDSLNLNY